jgi:hypothetical protein
MVSATMLVTGRGPMDPQHGFEAVGRAARLVISNSINNEIDRLQQVWSTADQEFEAAGFDVGVSAEGVEHISVENIFQGPHKSLAASPITRFPNVSVTAYATRPSAQDAQSDRIDVPELSLLVEVMVKAGPIVNGNDLLVDQILHRRVERTSEAVIAVIARSKNLYATVDSISLPRGGIVNASWTRNEASEGETGKTYVLQGTRFTYALIRRVSRNY